MRIFGINIPDEKNTLIALTYIYGVGLAVSRAILKDTGISPTKKARDLTPDEISKIQGFVEKNIRVEGELRQYIRSNIVRLKELKVYRGLRHARRLPVRGQRTKTNSRTVRGNVRKTAGSGKRKVELK
ncbi:MAG: ribosomal protein small subunit ribosomal protein [Candidatus Parcubacteria bacterium]|jgi:small subunit ribosomal protein S13